MAPVQDERERLEGLESHNAALMAEREQETVEAKLRDLSAATQCLLFEMSCLNSLLKHIGQGSVDI